MKFAASFLLTLFLGAVAQAAYTQDVYCQDSSLGSSYHIHFSDVNIPSAKAAVTYTKDGETQSWDLKGRFYMSIDMDTLIEFQGFIVSFDPDDFYEKVSLKTKFDSHAKVGSMTVKNEELTGRKGEVKIPCTRTENNTEDSF